MLHKLQINRFRNIASAEIVCGPDIHFFLGPNGSGKTSLLEAVYFLGLGRSFRTCHLDNLIQLGEHRFTVFGSNRETLTAGIEKARGEAACIQLGYQPASITQLTDFLPLILINTESLDILSEGPLQRRQLIDWGVFHVEPLFREAWRQWTRALKQRNTALKTKQPLRLCCAWDFELAKFGEAIHNMRLQFLEIYLPYVHACLAELLVDVQTSPKMGDFCAPFFEKAQPLVPPFEKGGLGGVSFHYEPGWPKDQSLLTVLGQGCRDDLKLGYTRLGPHRADLIIRKGDMLARERLSRGQQKLLVCALKLALGTLLHERLKKSCVYLLDDLQSELDQSARARFIDLLRTQDQQVFVTGMDFDSLASIIDPNKDAMFHVEQGRIFAGAV